MLLALSLYQPVQPMGVWVAVTISNPAANTSACQPSSTILGSLSSCYLYLQAIQADQSSTSEPSAAPHQAMLPSHLLVEALNEHVRPLALTLDSRQQQDTFLLPDNDV